jgi:peptide/nickel transport system substrate-binding protein
MMRSRTRIFGGLAVALATALAVGACSSSSSGSGGTGNNGSGATTVAGGIGSVPAAAAQSGKAATITWGYNSANAPNWILPVPSSTTNSVFNTFTFEWEMWRPTYWTVNGVDPELNESLSLANAPVYSNGDKTVAVTFKSAYKWSDGTPVNADDLLFDIDLIKAAISVAPSDWSGYVPGHFPDDVASLTEPNSSTLVINFKDSVNPTWFTDNFLGQGPLVPMPAQTWDKDSTGGAAVTDWKTNPADMKKIFNYLNAQSKAVNTYATNPLWQVVDGPYKLSAYDPSNGSFTMVPNTTYGGPHVTPQSTFQGVGYASDTAEFNAIKAGAVDMGYVPYDDVPQLPVIKRAGYDYFGEPDYGMNFAAYNFKDTTGDFNNIVKQLYFRQAMAHLQDQQGWINAYMHGAGDPAYGPIPAYPVSPYLPSDAATNPYPFSISAATTLLKDHGWTINAGGTDVCSSPGTGASQCGAGIPAGTKLAFNDICSTAPTLLCDQETSLVSDAKQAGINITLQTSNFDYMITNYPDPGAPANENKWAIMDFGGETQDPYATTFGLFNTGGSNQIGDYSDAQADNLITQSISGGDPAAVKNEASYLTMQQPVMFQPNPDYIWAWKNTISGQPQYFESLSQYYAQPEFWYTAK